MSLHIFGQGCAKIKKTKTKQNILSRFFFQSELRMIATPKVKMVSMNTLNSFFFHEKMDAGNFLNAPGIAHIWSILLTG